MSYSVLPSTSYAEAAAQIVAKQSWGTHYLFVQSDYGYYLFMASDMELSGSTFSSADAVVCSWQRDSGSYEYQFSTDSQTLSLDVGTSSVCSDLGFYPSLDVSYPSVDWLVLFSLVVACLVSLLGRLFASVDWKWSA